MLHHKKIDNSSTENLPNFTNPLYYNIEVENYTFSFKEATSQPYRLDFVETMRKEIGSNEIDKHWTLVIRRELNGENAIMSIWSFKINRDPDWRLIKHKSRLCAHEDM